MGRGNRGTAESALEAGSVAGFLERGDQRRGLDVPGRRGGCAPGAARSRPRPSATPGISSRRVVTAPAQPTHDMPSIAMVTTSPPAGAARALHALPDDERRRRRRGRRREGGRRCGCLRDARGGGRSVVGGMSIESTMLLSTVRAAGAARLEDHAAPGRRAPQARSPRPPRLTGNSPRPAGSRARDDRRFSDMAHARRRSLRCGPTEDSPHAARRRAPCPTSITR